MFTIVASTGSLGSATPNARPVSFSYWPTSPKARPSKVGDSTLSTTSLVMRESGERCASAAVPLGDWPRPSGVVGVHARTATTNRTARRFIPRPPPFVRRRRVGRQSTVCLGSFGRPLRDQPQLGQHVVAPEESCRKTMASRREIALRSLSGEIGLVGTDGEAHLAGGRRGEGRRHREYLERPLERDEEPPDRGTDVLVRVSSDDRSARAQVERGRAVRDHHHRRDATGHSKLHHPSPDAWQIGRRRYVQVVRSRTKEQPAKTRVWSLRRSFGHQYPTASPIFVPSLPPRSTSPSTRIAAGRPKLVARTSSIFASMSCPSRASSPRTAIGTRESTWRRSPSSWMRGRLVASWGPSR